MPEPALTRSDLKEIAERPEAEWPHICSQGIAMGSLSLQSGQLLDVGRARRMGAALLAVADEYEDLIQHIIETEGRSA